MKNFKIKILFISAAPITDFVKCDLDILKKQFDLKVIKWAGLINPLVLLRMISGVLWADTTFSWFADLNAFWAVRLSKLFRKKSIVIVGGYEVAKVPEIGYGLMLYPKFTHKVKYVLDNADKVLTVDDGLRMDAIKNAGASGKNIQTIPTGYDHELFKPGGNKENIVLTVSAGDSWSRARLKGLNTFVQSAKFLPDTKFLLIGTGGDALKKLQAISSTNIEFINQVSQDELIPYYQKAKVYCQLSMREGLPNALCEAMLCECVPVGTDVQGVRTAIGDTGFYVRYGDPEATAEAIKEALKSEKGPDARELIKNMFPIERREKELIEIIKEVY